MFSYPQHDVAVLHATMRPSMKVSGAPTRAHPVWDRRGSSQAHAQTALAFRFADV
jgi:hypothetical protein